MPIMSAIFCVLLCYFAYNHGKQIVRQIREKRYIGIPFKVIVIFSFLSVAVGVIAQHRVPWIDIVTTVSLDVMLGSIAIAFLVDCVRDARSKRWNSFALGALAAVSIVWLALTSNSTVAFLTMICFLVGSIMRMRYDSEAVEGRFTSKVLGFPIAEK